MNVLEDRIQYYLEKRAEEGNLRTLKKQVDKIDFCSNDYLGLSASTWIKQQVEIDYQQHYAHLRKSATGSRLLTGNSDLFEETESLIANFHKGESALLFNSGFDANVALVSTLARKGDVIYYDEFCHASILTGIKLSEATAIPFKHNDVGHLKTLFHQNPNGASFCITESIFSMEGDKCPLKELVIFCEINTVYLFLDEAHALGVVGEKGSGWAVNEGVEDKVFARVYTYGKALGAHGAAIVGSGELRQYMINFAKPFIYSTALDTHAVLSIKWGYNFLYNFDKQIDRLNYLNKKFYEILTINYPSITVLGQGPIFGILSPSNQEAKRVAAALQNDGFDIRPILYPTVPKGQERLRFILHSYNEEAQIIDFLHKLKLYLE
ncbi:MAG: pyridoxal phosphate-dependent aminotransferase family protein [Chitinophagales bacterium]|nr:pyridoxal phosphate-dependent aminotransferase family protein [Chitinophagales bacterium]